MDSCVSVIRNLSSLLLSSSSFKIPVMSAAGFRLKFHTVSAKFSAILDTASYICPFQSPTFRRFSLEPTAPVLGRAWAPRLSVVFRPLIESVPLDSTVGLMPLFQILQTFCTLSGRGRSITLLHIIFHAIRFPSRILPLPQLVDPFYHLRSVGATKNITRDVLGAPHVRCSRHISSRFLHSVQYP